MADFEFYEIGGRKYKRFSTVMEYFPHPKLVEWKIRMGKKDSGKISRDALKEGSAIDEYTYRDIRGLPQDKKKKSAELNSLITAWEAWKKDYPEVFRDIKSTQEVVHYEDWGCAGTLDFRTSKAIIDIKSSKRISLSYWMQTAFYNRKFQLPERWVLRLNKEFQVYEFTKCPDEYSQGYLEEFDASTINQKSNRGGFLVATAEAIKTKMVLPSERRKADNSWTAQKFLMLGQGGVGKSHFWSCGDRTLFLQTEAGLNHLSVEAVPLHSG
jgi:hypothetical protein